MLSGEAEFRPTVLSLQQHRRLKQPSFNKPQQHQCFPCSLSVIFDLSQYRDRWLIVWYLLLSIHYHLLVCNSYLLLLVSPVSGLMRRQWAGLYLAVVSCGKEIIHQCYIGIKNISLYGTCLDVRVKGNALQQVFKQRWDSFSTSRFAVYGSEWTYSCLVRGALSQVTSVCCPPSLVSVWTPVCCILPLGVDIPFSFNSLQPRHTQRFKLWWWKHDDRQKKFLFCENMHDTWIYTHSLTDFFWHLLTH